MTMKLCIIVDKDEVKIDADIDPEHTTLEEAGLAITYIELLKKWLLEMIDHELTHKNNNN